VKKIYPVMFYPFIMIVFSFAHIGFFAYLILLFNARGRFDARFATFQFTTNAIGEGIKYDGVSILILVFYILMLMHGLFLCTDIMIYMVGTSSVQHYFKNKEKRANTHYVAQSLGWMCLQFGSLVAESALSVVMFWLRPIFGVIVKNYPHLPENGCLRGMVKFSQWYVSLVSRETILSLGLTGKSLGESAKKYREFMNSDQHIAETLSKI
jgi:hypothetical protein